MRDASRLTICDYLIVGGGTAGAIVAARLAEDPRNHICLLEAGPSDEGNPRILNVRNWSALIGSELDYDYSIANQTRGNSGIRHSRGRVLGGCSSHNSCIAFRAPDCDLERWEQRGATDWGPTGTATMFDRVFNRVHIDESTCLNPCNDAFLAAANQAGFPTTTFGNQRLLRSGCGRFSLNVRAGIRQSASVAYLHPLKHLPPNLSVHTNTHVHRLTFDKERQVTGAETNVGMLQARREVILCCGAFDTPRLLMLSGIGPAEHLSHLGIRIQVNIPSVGEHLVDHPEGVVIWETPRPVPPSTHQLWECGLFARSYCNEFLPDLMLHFGLTGFYMHTTPLGYPTAENALSLTPNVARARSEGTVRLGSPDPIQPPLIDFRYFTDSDGHDERVMLAGIKLARRIARQPAMANWFSRELAPGPEVRSDADLSSYARSTSNTVYHPAGTCRMGAVSDASTVVDPKLRVRGVTGLRIADASVFPTMISVNPAITCMMIGEKCAEIIRS